MKITGLIPATVTPFTDSGAIDFEELTRHLRQVGSASGLYGIAVNGHAGEILAMNSEERRSVVAHAKSVLPTGLKLIAGIESHDIDDLVVQGLNAKAAGADMLLVLPPFDVRPYRMLAHDPVSVRKVFKRLNDEVALPMIIFQYGESSGVAYTTEALKAVADLPHVVGVKVGATSPTTFAEIMNAVGDQLSILAASDAPALLGMLLHKAHGALIGISVIGTQRWSDLVHEATQGSAQVAQQIHSEFAMPIMDAVFENQLHKTFTSYFAATKEALHQMGHLKSAAARAPLVLPDAKKKAEIAACLAKVGLLPS
jgi:4-hydroxy-tetrahydrodipicolinate synthase